MADVCTASAVPVTVNSGVDAILFYNRSNHESSKHFHGYRAYALSSLFAYITKTESEGRCTEPLNEICSKGRAEFKKWSQSLLMIKIFNVAVSDSGNYKVVALFSGSLYNSKMEKCLQVQHLTASGKQWTSYRFLLENDEILSNSKQNLIVYKTGVCFTFLLLMSSKLKSRFSRELSFQV